MELKITIELDENETKQALAFVRGLLGGILQVTSKVETEPQVGKGSESLDDLEPVVEEPLECHDCLDEVGFEVIEDEDCTFTVIRCEICGEDVSEEYQEAYGDEDWDDDYYDAMRELLDGGGEN